MNINIDSGMKPFRKEYMERNLRITPQLTVIYKELLKAKDRPNSNYLILEKQRIFSLTK